MRAAKKAAKKATKKATKITEADLKMRRQYRTAQPKQFGTLHERMQYLKAIILADSSRYSEDNALWHAIHDLEIEVMYHTPKSPPYGRRAITLSQWRKK